MKLLNKLFDYASCRDGAFVWCTTVILQKYQPLESFRYKYAPIGKFEKQIWQNRLFNMCYDSEINKMNSL